MNIVTFITEFQCLIWLGNITKTFSNTEEKC